MAHAHSSDRPRPWAWLAVVAAAFVGLMISVGWAFLSSAGTLSNGTTPILLDRADCRPVADWTEKATVFVRNGAAADQGGALAALSAHGPDGSPITVTPRNNTTLSTPAGAFNSIGVADLSVFAPGDEVCFDASALAGTLQDGDLVVLRNIVPPLIATIGGSCVADVLLAVVAIVGIAKARRSFSSR